MKKERERERETFREKCKQCNNKCDLCCRNVLARRHDGTVQVIPLVRPVGPVRACATFEGFFIFVTQLGAIIFFTIENISRSAYELAIRVDLPQQLRWRFFWLKTNGFPEA